MQKRGQLNLSFGMIFSIILIIVFLAFGFYAIKKFIDMQQTIQVETFLNDFETDVNAMWKSAQGSQTLVYSLPNKVNSVCFEDDEFENLKFVSDTIINGRLVEHLDIVRTTATEDPYCIQNVKGKLSLTLVKSYGESLVKVER